MANREFSRVEFIGENRGKANLAPSDENENPGALAGATGAMEKASQLQTEEYTDAPIAARRVVDHGFSAQNAALVNQYFAFMFIVVAFLAIGSSMRFYYVMWLGERVVADIRDALFKHLMELTPSFFETQKTGEVVSRLTADTAPAPPA